MRGRMPIWGAGSAVDTRPIRRGSSPGDPVDLDPHHPVRVLRLREFVLEHRGRAPGVSATRSTRVAASSWASRSS